MEYQKYLCFLVKNQQSFSFCEMVENYIQAEMHGNRRYCKRYNLITH